ncbi:MAG: methionyl-tRNA formyltransferase [Flavobacteriales bacterium]|nr:methionyl-tRNA formyltransferase [Flavobacteriales bacterium]
MKIAFFGTPDFASKILKSINQKNEIILVISGPDRRQGRGNKLVSTNVSITAKKLSIPLINPENLKERKFISILNNLNVDLFIVVAFRYLPKSVWSIPKLGTINLHTSYLPEYRGAAPINRVLMNGENYTGVSTFIINENIDCGDIIERKKIKINNNTTCGKLYNKLILEGSNILETTIQSIKKNELNLKHQIKKSTTYAPKISKEITKIDWKLSLDKVHNLIRSLSPVISEKEMHQKNPIMPGAWFNLINFNQKFRVKILLSKLEKKSYTSNLNVETDNKKFMKINAEDNSLYILKLQISGKKIMNISEFLSGFKIDSNCKLEI